MKRTGLKTVILTVTAISIMLTGGLVLTAPANASAARTAAAVTATVEVPNATVTVQRTPKCVLAMKRERKAKLALLRAQHGGTLTQVAHATTAWQNATVATQKACTPDVPATPPYDPNDPYDSRNPANHYNGDVNDPRPAGWTRPVDGSGLPGSNGVGFTITNCPAYFTVSGTEVLIVAFEEPTKYRVVISMENYSHNTVPYTVTYTSQDGTAAPVTTSRPGKAMPMTLDGGAGKFHEIVAVRDTVEDAMAIAVTGVRVTCGPVTPGK